MLTGRNDVPDGQLTDDWTSDRIVLDAEGWRITLENIEQRSQLFHQLREVGGFGLTHVGKLERLNGSLFSIKESGPILDSLYLFLSFVRGTWTNAILPVAFDARGNRCWERWANWRIDNWENRPSWCDKFSAKYLGLVFSGFLKRWLNPVWHDPIRLGVHWYVESNRGGDQEPGIILTQSALEMLASTLFVEELGRVSERDFDSARYPAHRKIRELLLWAGIAVELPPVLHNLHKAAAVHGWKDGPAAFTSTRNWFGHPTRSNRGKFMMLTGSGTSEAWDLGLWYLELILLRLFDFEGEYGNRLTQHHVGQVESVPWVTK